MTLYELIDMVRMRPELYIGHPSPTHLCSFILGYSLAINFELGNNEEPSFHEFHDWVASLFDYYESITGWAYMIEDQREDKKEALYLFYELLDKYRGIHHKQLASVKYTHERTTDRTWRGYSRMKKVRGTFEAVPKPLPMKLIIRELEMEPPWF